jgi:uncharacterized repeat protein (TIGR01451 family)
MNTPPRIRISLLPFPSFRILSQLLVLLSMLPAPLMAQSVITTFAGGVNPSNGATAITISFGPTSSVISDGAGGFYFAAQSPQHSIYRVGANGAMTLVAGNGLPGFSGDGGPAVSAQLNYPAGIALDSVGNLLIADTSNHRIRKVTPLGVISTVAGNGTQGFSGDNGAATSAQLNYPNGVAVDAVGNLLIADTSNYRIRRVTAAGIIDTIAGTGTSGFSGDGGPATSARLSYFRGIVFDSGGNLFIADTNNYRVRKIDPSGIISTVAGNGTYGFNGDGVSALSARLASPSGVAFDGSGNLLIADYGNSRIRKVASSGVISTVAGNGTSGFTGDGGQATLAQLNSPNGLAVDAGSGDLLIADTANRRIRKVSSSGIINTVAGNGTQGFGGDGGPAVNALFDTPRGVAVDAAGNVLVADTNNSRLRRITPAGIVSTFAGIAASGFTGDGGPATSARLSLPGSVAPAPDGSVYLTDCNNRLRKIGPDGVINTISSGWDFCTFDYYYYYDEISRGSVALDAAGNLYVSDTYRYRISKITPAGIASIYAGTGQYGLSGDGGLATSARISDIGGIALDASGNLYIADSSNNRIRMVTTAGIISTVAGGDQAGFAGDGGPGLSAQFSGPTALAMDATGNLYIADTFNNRIRKMSPAGIITTVAGNGTPGVNGDGGPPTLAQLDSPGGIALDQSGNLYIADTNNSRIRKVTFALTIPTLTGVSTNFGAQGATSKVTFSGTSLSTPLTINAGSDITVSNISVLSELQATATFTIAANANLGPRNVTVTTGLGTSGSVTFTVVPPFPDLSIASTQTGNLETGFDGTYVLAISNAGSGATTSPITVTDNLPAGLTFVSGSGAGWACSASGQTVTCVNPGPLAAGASTTLTLTVTVQSGTASRVSHSATVAADGDLLPSNNAVSDSRNVIIATVNLSISPGTLLSGIQGTVSLSIPSPFTHEVTGTLALTFASGTTIPGDDPAIQFAGGGRTVNFTIAPNTNVARFSSSTQSGPVFFQTGTVAGTLSFNVTLKTGVAQTTSSFQRAIASRPPAIQSMQREPGATASSLSIAVTLISNSREVTQLSLLFSTSPAPTLSCGNLAGCAVSGSNLTLDVKSLFDGWFSGNTQFGGSTVLHVPLTIEGTIKGSIIVSLRNSVGFSNTSTFTLP